MQTLKSSKGRGIGNGMQKNKYVILKPRRQSLELKKQSTAPMNDENMSSLLVNSFGHTYRRCFICNS
jgi:hypothetical protein